MAKPTLFIALLLILVGAYGYYAGHVDPTTGHPSYTALIPAAVGVVLGLLGLIALIPAARKHAMHVAAMVGLLALIGDGFQLLKTINNTETAPDVRQLKIISMGAPLALCLIFLILCIRSFITARRSRQAAQ